jgi:hypothetical protein
MLAIQDSRGLTVSIKRASGYSLARRGARSGIGLSAKT